MFFYTDEFKNNVKCSLGKNGYSFFTNTHLSTLHKPTQRFLQKCDWKSSQTKTKNDGFNIFTFNNSLTCPSDSDVPEADTAPPLVERDTTFIDLVRYFCIVLVQRASDLPATRHMIPYHTSRGHCVSFKVLRSPSHGLVVNHFQNINLWSKSTEKHALVPACPQVYSQR